MAKTNIKKATRSRNTVGKLAGSIAAAVGDCDAQALPTPRRSIPVAEVHGIIEREVARVKSELTIFDDRVAVLRRLQENEADLEHLQRRLHETMIQNKQIRSDLSRINLAITRQMELDGE